MFLLKQTFALSTLLSRIIFTFHNVSIKTCPAALYITTLSPLHSTMFLLKPKNADQRNRRFPALHSTMFLLKLFCLLFQILILFFFTFHNVSIKTRSAFTQPIFFMPLHSTMFLLKRDCGASSATGDYFTFHNVSIKTDVMQDNLKGKMTLHSTMFLLKRLWSWR